MNEKKTAEPLQKRIELLHKHAQHNERMNRHRFFFGYLYDIVTHAPFYTHWKNLISYFRRLRMVALLLRVFTLILTVLETGALVILATAVFLVILPIIMALMLGILLTALLESRRTNRLLQKKCGGKHIYVLFMHEGENAFLYSHARGLADAGACVIAVSPYWISAKGMEKGRFYCTAREESENIFLIRRYYFFSLRKHVLQDADVAYIY